MEQAELLEAQRKTLLALGENVMPQSTDLNTVEHLKKLIVVCVALAKFVHSNQYDLAAKPYFPHVQRVAADASTVFSFCASILHDVLEDGEALGITEEFLLTEVRLPNFLTSTVGSLSRRDGETRRQYEDRILHNYLGAKIKLRDGKDNSDITRYDFPHASDLSRCFEYMHRNQRMKSNHRFQEEAVFDILHELIGVASLDRMIYAIEDHGIVKELIEPVANTKREDWVPNGQFLSAHFCFGYEGYSERFYTLIFTGIISVSRNVRVELTAIPSQGTLVAAGIFKPQRTTKNFSSIEAAQEFLESIKQRVTSNFYMRPCHEAQRDTLLFGDVRREKTFIEELNNNFCF